MPFPKKDSVDGRSGGANAGRVQNGSNRSGFRTDTAISNSRHGNEKVLKPWVPDAGDTFNEGLEKPAASGPWDQFAANEKLFGLRTDYDENMYTTSIDKAHPQYKERMAAADRKAREIEKSAAVTSHVAEERVMDFAGGDDRNGDEEDKYSGVRRQDQPASRENKYTPPAKRAPTGQSNTSGVPHDPAIISSQLKVAQPKKAAQASASDKAPTPRPEQPKPESKPKVEKPEKPVDAKPQDAAVSEIKPADAKGSEKSTPLRSPAATGGSTPSATATVERDVLNSFKNFAAVQRSNAEKVRIGKAKADKEVKLTELKFFANSFKLSTPVPNDLIGIIAKDPNKQKEIQARAMQNAEDVQKAKEAAKLKEAQSKEAQSKPSPASQVPTPAADSKPQTSRPQAPHTASHPSVSNRHGGNRQSYGPSAYNTQQFPRGDRSGQQQSQGRPTGNLAQRLRNVEHHKASQAPHVSSQTDARAPPTAPANGGDGSFSRRTSGTPGHVNKLNPNTQEFRPNAFAPAFNPAGHPSTTSSPKSAIANHGADTHSASPARQVIRRKTKAVDCKKCDILSLAKTIKPPPSRSWDENGGLRPTYDTPPTWRQVSDKEETGSTMHFTYKQYLERNPFASPPGILATPNPAPVLPHMAHQHQLPFHLQHGAHMVPRPSPNMAPMQMHAPPHGHTPHMGYANTDDHRMVHSNSSQSFASPRMSQAPVAYPTAMNSPAQVPYGQPVMQPYSGNAPHMGQYRSFSNNPQYMPQQHGHMSGPMMIQPQFVGGPQGMLVTPPQMQMYPSSQGQFIPPGGVAAPPQPMSTSNGYPSPGRPAAPPMAHQGSAQGQQVYGMSPSMSYQQPVFGGQPPSHMNNARGGYGSPAGPHQYGSSPQHLHQYGAQHRAGNNNYGNKNFGHHGQHQMAQSHSIPSGPQGRAPDGGEEGK
ncbi:related to PBP1 - Pab1p interacting protein [Cephalotrichum gorgonifer]|uniref:Related to PBP1 - Pab1p interacting protein n=1 Tax=Cephalotrichum gorgonifer TaxID=2041049 RepID=A0AAE8N6F6_9PEZI|nr:related to PBP1 - Pab1p interacting protein [Cephalotrichum gorgonifer]